MPSLLDEITTPSDLKTLSDQQLAQLADELRVDVIEAVSRTGGHLGSSLGVVELTVALHAVFNTPKDKLIWDVGHQCYPHKVLTGRRADMGTLRQEGGLSGFTKRSESPYDPFGAAHSSTSISAAHGFTVARDLDKIQVTPSPSLAMDRSAPAWPMKRSTTQELRAAGCSSSSTTMK